MGTSKWIFECFESTDDRLVSSFSIFAFSNNFKTKTIIFPKKENFVIKDLDFSKIKLSNDNFTFIMKIDNSNEIKILYIGLFKVKKSLKLYVEQETQNIDNKIICIIIESKEYHPRFFYCILKDIYLRSKKGEINANSFIDTKLFKNEIMNMNNEIHELQKYFFSMFKPNQIISLINYLLCGCSFVVVSSNYSQIGVGAFGLLALLHPIRWVYNFIPFLQDLSSLKDDKFIAGIDFYSLQSEKNRNIMTTPDVYLNLDFYNITITKQFSGTSKELPYLTKKIESLLLKEIVVYQNTGLYSVSKIQTIIWQYIFGLLLISTNLIESNPTLNDLISKINTPPNNTNVIERTILESPIIQNLTIEISSSQKRLNEFLSIFNKMEPILKSIRKHLK